MQYVEAIDTGMRHRAPTVDYTTSHPDVISPLPFDNSSSETGLSKASHEKVSAIRGAMVEFPPHSSHSRGGNRDDSTFCGQT
jgi:hypothetical protein